MPSRMERYYKTDTPKQRSSRNQSLYDSIYEEGTYSNIETIATIDKPNEIDIDQVRQLIKPEEKKARRRFENSFRDPNHQISVEKDYDTSTYDIRDVLSKAKNERTSDSSYRNLRNTQYDILKNLDLKRDEEKEDLKELFHTITNASKLNKLGDKELSLDMLDDLKSTNVDATLSVTKVKEEKGNYVSQELKNTNDIDKSFFTSSMDFGKEDFDDFASIEKPKKHIFLKILVFLLSVIIITGTLLVVYEFVIKR